MKIPIFPGKYHQNGGFSMSMLVSGRVFVCFSSASHFIARKRMWRYGYLLGLFPTRFGVSIISWKESITVGSNRSMSWRSVRRRGTTSSPVPNEWNKHPTVGWFWYSATYTLTVIIELPIFRKDQAMQMHVDLEGFASNITIVWVSNCLRPLF